MCRLIGIEGCSKIDKKVQENIWREFFDLSKNGCVPKTVEAGHRDGYGVVGYKQGAIAFYYRSEVAPYEDKNLENILELLVSMDLDLAMGHLRKATKGQRSVENNQPFIKEELAFATNGTIHFPELGDGDNDSKILFNNLVVNRNVDEVLQGLTGVDYTSATLLFTDGNKISAARWFNQEHEVANELDFNSYYTLYKTVGNDFRIFSSEVTSSFENLEADSVLIDNKTVEK